MRFPLQPSPNGHYLIDQDGQPFLFYGDAGWRIAIRLTLDEAQYYLDDRRTKGFNAILMHAVNKEKEGTTNRAGQEPFLSTGALTEPNEAYWQHLDQVLDAATQRGLVVALSAAWLGYNGKGFATDLTVHTAAAYGQFLGQRHGHRPNLIWILGGDNDPGPRTEATRVLAAALRSTAPAQLLTYHAGPEHSSATFFPDDDWLDINLGYTYGDACRHLQAEHSRLGKVRPLLLGETGYEGEGNTGLVWTTALVRRQAYQALLSGACGQAQGSKTIWHFGEGWQDALDMPATRQMKYVYAAFAPRAWWKLIPDFEHALVTHGYESPDGTPPVTAGQAEDGSFALIYIPSPREITVNLAQLKPGMRSYWYDPSSGRVSDAGGLETSTHQFEPPGSNAAGDADWLLILE